MSRRTRTRNPEIWVPLLILCPASPAAGHKPGRLVARFRTRPWHRHLLLGLQSTTRPVPKAAPPFWSMAVMSSSARLSLSSSQWSPSAALHRGEPVALMIGQLPSTVPLVVRSVQQAARAMVSMFTLPASFQACRLPRCTVGVLHGTAEPTASGRSQIPSLHLPQIVWIRLVVWNRHKRLHGAYPPPCH